MLSVEKNYDFLKRFRKIHQPDRRTVFRNANVDEVMIDQSWSIYCENECADEIKKTVADLQDYLQVSQFHFQSCLSLHVSSEMRFLYSLSSGPINEEIITNGFKDQILDR